MRKQIAVLSLVALCFALTAAAFVRAEEQKSSGYGDITISELKAVIADKSAVILDVNGTDSYNSGHIPTAQNFEAVKDKLATVLPKDKDALVVAYCGGPQCSAYKQAVTAALAMGYTNVKHLKPGISGWKQAGEKTEKAG
jgi:rhodanese-related sulfurtransferase